MPYLSEEKHRNYTEALIKIYDVRNPEMTLPLIQDNIQIMIDIGYFDLAIEMRDLLREKMGPLE